MASALPEIDIPPEGRHNIEDGEETPEMDLPVVTAFGEGKDLVPETPHKKSYVNDAVLGPITGTTVEDKEERDRIGPTSGPRAASERPPSRTSIERAFGLNPYYRPGLVPLGKRKKRRTKTRRSTKKRKSTTKRSLRRRKLNKTRSRRKKPRRRTRKSRM